MTPLNIRFHADRDEVIFPDIEPERAQQAEIDEVVVVANGAYGADGKDRPSVLVRVNLDDRDVICLTTARLFCTAAKMIMARYPDLFEGEE